MVQDLCTTRRRLLAGLAVIGCAPVLLGASEPMVLATMPQPYYFQVFRNGEPLGSHIVKFQRKGGELIVAVDVDFQVDIAFVTAFRYTHRNREIWREGRLVRIESRTDHDGTPLYVSGYAGAEDFTVNSSRGSFKASLDVIPTSYWNPKTIDGRVFLNTQDGELIEGQLQPKGRVQLATGNGQKSAERYHFGGKQPCDFYYGGREWMGLSAVMNGDEISYKRVATEAEARFHRPAPATPAVLDVSLR